MRPDTSGQQPSAWSNRYTPLYISAAAFYVVLAVSYFTNPQLMARPLLAVLLLIAAAATWIASYRQFRKATVESWMVVLIFLVPLDFSTALPLLPSYSPLDYLALAALIALLMKTSFRTLSTRIIDAFGQKSLFLWFLFFVYADVLCVVLHGNPRIPLRWGLFLLVYYLGYETFRTDATEAIQKRLLSLLSYLGGGIGFLAAGQWLFYRGQYEKVQVTFGHHNGLGAFLLFCLPAAWVYWRQSKRGLTSGLCFVFSALGFLSCYSRGAWLGLLVGSLLVLLSQKQPQLTRERLNGRILEAAAVIGVLAAMAWKWMRWGLTGRDLHWEAAARVIQAHPFVGLGPGNYMNGIQQYLSGEGLRLYVDNLKYDKRPIFWIHLHSLYLQAMVDYGIVGAVLLFSALGLLILRALRAQRSSALVMAFRISILGFLVHNFFDITTVHGFDVLFAILIAAVSFPPADASPAPGRAASRS